MLTVSGVLPSLDLGAQGERILGERPVGEFRRTIPLPASVDAEKISASSRHGVLTVTIPKNEQQKARKIPVHSAPGPQV
jgi:HSP20 family protein